MEIIPYIPALLGIIGVIIAFCGIIIVLAVTSILNGSKSKVSDIELHVSKHKWFKIKYDNSEKLKEEKSS